MLFYLNVLSCEAISGNNTETIPDHLPQFFLLPMCFQILFAINQISWEETGQNVTKKILFLIILIKIGLNSPTWSAQCEPINGFLFGSYECYFRYSYIL